MRGLGLDGHQQSIMSVKKYSQRELVINALLKGKEQRKHYSHQLQTSSAVTTVLGTAAVVLKEGAFWLAIEEIHDPPVKSAAMEEYDVEELHHFSDLAETESFLSQRLNLELDTFGPARGSRRFW